MISDLDELKYEGGYPTAETTVKLYDQLDLQRAAQAYLDFMPAIPMQAFLDMHPRDHGVSETGGMIVYTEPGEGRSKDLGLTYNTESIYASASVDLKQTGPAVIEVPRNVLGVINDGFFLYLTDLGNAGPDRGQGGKYLFLPPGYEGEVPDGYHVAPTRTYLNYVLMRAFVIDGDLAKTVAHVKKHWRLYPLKEAANPREPHFVDLSGLQYNTVHANDFSFYEELNAVVQSEPADAFNPELVGLWASIGIKKGKPFAPDKRMKQILAEAAAVGNATARALSFRPRSREPYFYEDRQWYTAFVGGSHEFMNNGELMLDYRTFMHYVATGITPAMAHSAVGQGSAYAFTAHDAQGRYLDGGKTYRVTLPAPIPAKEFWSFAVYSGQHRGLLETDQRSAGVDSLSPDLQANPDGSYTVWFAPTAPAGKEGNWVQTMPGKSWSVLVRLYGPLEPWFDKSWKPSDIELVT